MSTRLGYCVYSGLRPERLHYDTDDGSHDYISGWCKGCQAWVPVDELSRWPEGFVIRLQQHQPVTDDCRAAERPPQDGEANAAPESGIHRLA